MSTCSKLHFGWRTSVLDMQPPQPKRSVPKGPSPAILGLRGGRARMHCRRRVHRAADENCKRRADLEFWKHKCPAKSRRLAPSRGIFCFSTNHDRLDDIITPAFFSAPSGEKDMASGDCYIVLVSCRTLIATETMCTSLSDRQCFHHHQ